MLKKLSILGTVALLSACQTTVESVSEGPRVSSQNVENSVYMKDTRPRGLGTSAMGKWNQDMPENAWAFNLTNIVPARSGELSQRFELRNGDCTVMRTPHHPYDWGCHNDRERAEVMHTSWKPGKDMWMGFSVMIPKEWTNAKRNHCTGIFQIKQTENNVYQGNLGSKSGFYATSQAEVDKYGGHYVGGPQVMRGSICGDTYNIEVTRLGFKDTKYNGWSRNERSTYGSVNQLRGEWNDIVMRWDTSDYHNGKSTLEIYFNGELAGKWENLTNNFFPDNYTFKYGLYRSYMKANNGPNFKIGTQVVYFDEVRVGNSFDAVNPATNRTID